MSYWQFKKKKKKKKTEHIILLTKDNVVKKKKGQTLSIGTSKDEIYFYSTKKEKGKRR